MSLLSLPLSQLSRLHLQIRLLQTSAGLSFTLETLASPPSHTDDTNSVQSINFRTGHDERGPVLEIFSTCTEEPEATSSKVITPSPPTPPTTMDTDDSQSIQHSAPAVPPFDVGSNNGLSAEGLDGILAELDQGLLSSLTQDPSQGFNTFWDNQLGDPALLESLDFLLPQQKSNQSNFDFNESLFSDDSWIPSSLPSAPSSASVSSAASTSSSRVSTPELVEDSGSASEQTRKRGDRSDRRRLPCPVPNCGRRFTSQYTLKVHVKAHRPKPKPCFPCTQGCNEQFSRQHDRLRHEVAKHRMVCEWSCPECHRFFSSSKTLGNHKCKAAKNLPGAKWNKAS